VHPQPLPGICRPRRSIEVSSSGACGLTHNYTATFHIIRRWGDECGIAGEPSWSSITKVAFPALLRHDRYRRSLTRPGHSNALPTATDGKKVKDEEYLLYVRFHTDRGQWLCYTIHYRYILCVDLGRHCPSLMPSMLLQRSSKEQDNDQGSPISATISQG
jgi:hypothetical protein